MFHTYSPDFPNNTFALQGISERRLVAASQCLEALDKRLPGMSGSWRGGGHLEVYHSATAKPSHAGISSCENGEADMVGRILATLAVSLLHFYIMPLPGASSICLVQMMSISSTIRLHWRHGKSWRLAALSPSTSSARDGGAPLWPPLCGLFYGFLWFSAGFLVIFGHSWLTWLTLKISGDVTVWLPKCCCASANRSNRKFRSAPSCVCLDKWSRCHCKSVQICFILYIYIYLFIYLFILTFYIFIIFITIL